MLSALTFRENSEPATCCAITVARTETERSADDQLLIALNTERVHGQPNRMLHPDAKKKQEKKTLSTNFATTLT